LNDIDVIIVGRNRTGNGLAHSKKIKNRKAESSTKRERPVFRFFVFQMFLSVVFF